MENARKITVVCEGGWTYKGFQTSEKLSPLGTLEWIQIETRNGTVRINSKYIVSIIKY